MRTRVLTLFAALSMFGCAADELPTLALMGFHGLSVESDSCTHTSEQMSSSTYDTGIATTYGMPFNFYVHLRNEMAPHASEETGQVESNRVEVDRMRVSFEGEGWDELPAPLELPVTGVSIYPNSEYWKHISPISVVEAEILDRQFSLGEGQVKNLRVRLSFSGRTLDGTEVRSNELSYLVNVCRGCVGCPPGHAMYAGCGLSLAQGDGIVCEEIDED